MSHEVKQRGGPITHLLEPAINPSIPPCRLVLKNKLFNACISSTLLATIPSTTTLEHYFNTYEYFNNFKLLSHSSLPINERPNHATYTSKTLANLHTLVRCDIISTSKWFASGLVFPSSFNPLDSKH